MESALHLVFLPSMRFINCLLQSFPENPGRHSQENDPTALKMQ